MKIESLSPEHDHRVFQVDFELNQTTGLHEAHVASNAIAARNRAAFETVSFDSWTNADHQLLAETTAHFLKNGMDKFLAAIQWRSREKSREGVLGDTVRLKATDSNLDYLHRALSEYKLNTGVAVLSEMKNAMGNQAGMVRTLEAVVADPMVMCIENNIDVTRASEPERQPLGFGRVLLDSHEIA